LIDVQQTLIETNPNPLKNTSEKIGSSNPGKTNKNPISVNFFVLNPIPEKNNIPKENRL
jgi:hypothetical protein